MSKKIVFTRLFATSPSLSRWVRIMGLFIALGLVVILPLRAQQATPTTQQHSTVFHAAFAMPDRFSADVVEKVLRDGGNAVDAAIAGAFCLAVTLPEAGNIGGGGFMLAHFNQQNTFLDYREVAPMTANRDMYLDKNGEVIEQLSLVGGKSSGVPGTVAGLWQAHQKFGSLPWKRLVEPAILLAEQGFIVPEKLALEKQDASQWLSNKPNSNFDRYFGTLEQGKLFIQADLAKTLRRIAENGPSGFYQGETAGLIVAQMQRSGGLIGLDDLADYRAVWREPLQGNWHQYQVISSPPPSSGGIALLQLLMMKQLLSPQFNDVVHNSPRYIHLLAEMEKRVYADRGKYLGDPDFIPVPIQQLLDPDYLASRAAQVQPLAISDTEKVMPGLKESHQTTHFSILDQWGNAVSNTYTLNLSFGSGVVVEGAGFLLNNEMDDFSAKPGVPNAFGVIGGKANEIAPRKRMLSSMTPTLLLENGQIVAVVGSPGGSTIITSVFQTLVNLVDFQMSAQQSVDATRVHHQLFPANTIFYNPTLPPETQQRLADQGYELQKDYLGDVQLVSKLKGTLYAAADSRGRGVAKVVQWQQ